MAREKIGYALKCYRCWFDMNAPNYLLKNRERILNLPIQSLSPASIRYQKELFMRFDVMKKIWQQFPDRLIKRTDIVWLFQNNEFYLGFIVAMIWGNISLYPAKGHAGHMNTTPLYRLLSEDQDRIKTVVEETLQMILSNRLVEAFIFLSPRGKGKMAGVDYSFFTKLLFFLGQADESIETKPLIMDQWTAKAYGALLLDSSDPKASKYFKINDKRDKKIQLTLPSTVPERANLYRCFVADMNLWALELGVTPDKLEQFIFGIDLRKDKQKTNPRRELWNIIMTSMNELPKVKNRPIKKGKSNS